jgi:hypothetical protein
MSAQGPAIRHTRSIAVNTVSNRHRRGLGRSDRRGVGPWGHHAIGAGHVCGRPLRRLASPRPNQFVEASRSNWMSVTPRSASRRRVGGATRALHCADGNLGSAAPSNTAAVTRAWSRTRTWTTTWRDDMGSGVTDARGCTPANPHTYTTRTNVYGGSMCPRVKPCHPGRDNRLTQGACAPRARP